MLEFHLKWNLWLGRSKMALCRSPRLFFGVSLHIFGLLVFDQGDENLLWMLCYWSVGWIFLPFIFVPSVTCNSNARQVNWLKKVQ